MNEWFGGELAARVGVYTDFQAFDVQSIRLTGSGMFVLTFSPSLKVKAGVWYLNRNYYKLLPTGGVVWTPNPDVRWDILFPNPKLAKRLATVGNTDWWWYVSGDYGGGNWTIKRGNEPGTLVPGQTDQVNYNDIRVAIGLEFKRLDRLSGLVEIGGAFDRQLVYTSNSPTFYYPSNTIFLRGELTY